MTLIPDDAFWLRISELCLCILGSTLLCQLNSSINVAGGPFLSRIAHLGFDGYTLIWTTLFFQYVINETTNTLAEEIFLVVGCALHLIVALTAIVSSFANKCRNVLLLIMGIICMLIFSLMLTDLLLALDRKKTNRGLFRKNRNITNQFYANDQ